MPETCFSALSVVRFAGWLLSVWCMPETGLDRAVVQSVTLVILRGPRDVLFWAFSSQCSAISVGGGALNLESEVTLDPQAASCFVSEPP